MKKIQLKVILITLIVVSMLVSGCGKKSKSDKAKETSKETKQTNQSETKSSKVVEKTEKATAETTEDGKLKVTTESGEQMEVDLGSDNVQVVEESDGSKTYKTKSGERINVASNGQATVITETEENQDDTNAQNVIYDGGSNDGTNNNSTNNNGSNNNGTQGNSTQNQAGNTTNIDNNQNNDTDSGGNTDSSNSSNDNCQLGYDDSICRGAHTFVDDEVVYPPTCQTEGSMSQVCISCGCRREYPIPKAGHDMEWICTRAATMASEGERQLICKNCHEVLATETISKLYDPGLEDPTWTVDSPTQKHKTMYDGTVLTLYYVETEAGKAWGYFDRDAAVSMFAEIQNMQTQVYGEGSAFVWDESWYEYAKARTVHYAVAGAPMYGGLYHMNSGGVPNVKDNRKYITFMNGYGGGTAIACFVIDSAGAADNFYYGEWWRSYFGTYYSSPT